MSRKKIVQPPQLPERTRVCSLNKATGKPKPEKEKRTKMKSRLITLSAACVALFATISFGQAPDPAAKNDERHARWHHKRGNPLEHLTKALDLTPEQQAKIQPIFDQAR